MERKEKAMMSREDLLKRMRQKREERAQRKRDPNEFKIPTLKKGDKPLFYYFRILPPLEAGDACAEGVCSTSNAVDNWYYENGCHWMPSAKRKGFKDKLECPRIHDKEDCPICTTGFELLQDLTIKEERDKIVKQYLARTYFAVNIYFLNTKDNAEDIRGKVMWYNMSSTIFKICDDCIANDDGGSGMDPKAAGIFFHPTEGGYTMKLEVIEKGGYNSYDRSTFLASSFGHLLKDELPKLDKAGAERICEILGKRFILQSKFTIRDKNVLQEAMDIMTSTIDDDDETENIDTTGEAKQKVIQEQHQETLIKPEKKLSKTTITLGSTTPGKIDKKSLPKEEEIPEPEPENQSEQTTEDVSEDASVDELLKIIQSGRKKS